MTYQNDNAVRLTELIAPPFYKVHNDVMNLKHTHYNLFGGRGSTKSSFASVEIILGIIQDERANAVVFRKVANTLRESVYAQIEWAIDALNLTEYFIGSKSPLKFTYTPTGQVVIFRGLDNARKTKSIKCPRGYFKYIWFEELDEFDGAEEIRTAQQSVMRGGEKFCVFHTFNPPISINNWANQFVLVPDKRALNHSSDYRDVPVDWLGQEFINEAEHLKAVNPKAYEHEYLGKAVGLGTNIFDLLEIRDITDEEIDGFERIYQGQDWGWYPDPKAFVRLSYSHATEKVYLIDELGGCKIRNKDMAEQIALAGYDDYDIICGADEQQSIVDYRDAGLPARSTVASAGSVRYEMEWLQCRTIVIDPKRTPKAYKEIINYEHDRDGNGDIISGYPDKDNHYIDAMRYAISTLALRRGNSA